MQVYDYSKSVIIRMCVSLRSGTHHDVLSSDPIGLSRTGGSTLSPYRILVSSGAGVFTDPTTRWPPDTLGGEVGSDRVQPLQVLLAWEAYNTTS